MLVYVASPYSVNPSYKRKLEEDYPFTPEVVDTIESTVREERYKRVAHYIINKFTTIPQVFYFSPIVYWHHTATLEKFPTDAMHFKEFNYHVLKGSTRMEVLQLSGWDKSVGVKWEIDWADELHIPVSYIKPQV